jgi:hypothetical protein
MILDLRLTILELRSLILNIISSIFFVFLMMTVKRIDIENRQTDNITDDAGDKCRRPGHY